MTPTEKFEAKFRRPKPGRTLIVGSRIYPTRQDRRKLYPDAVGVDMLAGPGVDYVCNLEEPYDWTRPGPASKMVDGFDHIECISVLEHSRRPWLLAANLERLMTPGATLHLSVPFVWRVHSYPSDYWRFTVEAVRELFPSIQWAALRYVTERRIEKPQAPTQGVVSDAQTFFARSEVIGFGMKT